MMRRFGCKFNIYKHKQVWWLTTATKKHNDAREEVTDGRQDIVLKSKTLKNIMIRQDLDDAALRGGSAVEPTTCRSRVSPPTTASHNISTCAACASVCVRESEWVQSPTSAGRVLSSGAARAERGSRAAALLLLW